VGRVGQVGRNAVVGLGGGGKGADAAGGKAGIMMDSWR